MPQIVMGPNGEACISYEFDALKAECLEIKQICDKYGNANVMEWASALWRHMVIKDGYGRGIAETGCFVPTNPEFIKEEFKCPEIHAQYDNLVQAVLGNPEKEESADAKIH